MNDTKTAVERRQLTHAEQIADRCVHFTGLQNGVCKAGVSYASVKIDHEPIPYTRRGVTYSTARSFPCLASYNAAGAVCEKRCAPTPDQVAAEEAESARMIEDVVKARGGITEATNGKRGVSGTIICPRCLGTLHYSVARSNGHVCARCATEGCLAWME
jgi:hypothetical protein